MALNLGEWETFKEKLEKLLDTDQVDVLMVGAKAAAVKLDQVTRDNNPPPPRKLRQSQWWTQKQKAWFWATMRAKALGQSRALPGWNAKYVDRGGRRVLVISGGYKRTGKLMQSLAYRIESGYTTDKPYVIVQYGSKMNYAPWVIDEDRQARYHRGNWHTLQNILSAVSDRLVDLFSGKVFEEIEARL